MSTARLSFIERMISLEQSLKIEAVEHKGLPGNKKHNDIAKLLRNGLVVVGFAALEDFIKSRTSEIMDAIGQTSVKFLDLPLLLQNATTYEAISALTYQLKILEKDQRTIYIQEQALKIASTADTSFSLTPHALAFSQPNINVDTIKNILKCFQVENSWANISLLSSRIGLTALSLEETFRTAMLRRHKAAHVSNADTPQSDILQFVKDAFGTALGFDSLISTALQKIAANDYEYVFNKKMITAEDIVFREIKYVDGKWKEFVGSKLKAFRTSIDLEALKSSAIMRATSSKSLLIQYDEFGKIVWWNQF